MVSACPGRRSRFSSTGGDRRSRVAVLADGLKNASSVFSFGTKFVDRRLVAVRKCICVLEYLNKRQLMLFAAAFGVAISLMAWTINLSIDRLLFADGDERSSPRLSRVHSEQDRPACGAGRIDVPELPSPQPSAEIIEPCHTAELDLLQPHIGLK
jgi:hypothetical protein